MSALPLFNIHQAQDFYLVVMLSISAHNTHTVSKLVLFHTYGEKLFVCVSVCFFVCLLLFFFFFVVVVVVVVCFCLCVVVSSLSNVP